ncbi:hypothetical protein TNCV_3289601 [Trichonephila clavipes]|nr:hypothetical protein TNCV_3289601 [Trichonephila clavipes]
MKSDWFDADSLCVNSALGEGPLNFEPFSSDEDNTKMALPSPKFPIIPTGGHSNLDISNVLQPLYIAGLL